jgi:hypothetical protein
MLLGFLVADYIVYLRPGLSDFLLSLFKKFHVIVWTSMEKRRATAVVNYVLGSDFKPLRILSREHCTFIPDLPNVVTDGFSFGANVGFKILDEAIWHSPEDYGCVGFIPSRSNTLLVVDKPLSSLLNPPYSCIYCPRFTSAVEVPKFLTDILMPWLLEWRRSNIRLSNFLRENPIGLPCILTSSEAAKTVFGNVCPNTRKYVRRFM